MGWTGFAGTVLWVDLSDGTVRKEPLPSEIVERFVGGWGFTNKLAYDLIEPGTDPLGPENVVVIGSGAFTGTLAPGSTKSMATTKFPINGAIGTAFAGGFGHLLKCAGYDCIVIRGKSDRPVYLRIMDDDVTLEDAGDVWGRDTLETTDFLRAKHGVNSSVIAIGPAGENLAKISLAIVDKFGTLGGGGLAAVLGAKNLKGLVVNGSKGVRVADAEGFLRTSDAVRRATLGYPFRKDWLKLGPAIGMWVISAMGSRKNRSEGFSETETPERLLDALLKIFRSGHACPTCTLNCRALVGIEEESGDWMIPMASISNHTYFHNRFDGCDLDTSVLLLDFCSRNGLDASAAVGLLEFAVDLYQRGIIAKDDAEGQELRWDAATARTLLEKITRREGLGDILAEGLVPTAGAFGKAAADRMVAVKGQELWGIDPRRRLSGWELTASVNPRGTYLASGVTPAFSPGRTPDQIARYCQKLGVPEDAIQRICYSDTEFSLPRLIKWSEDWYSAYSCLGVCVRQPVMLSYDPETAAGLYTAATGIEMTPEELHEAGERAWNLVKAANVREGFDRKDDKFPKRFFEPLKAGDKEIRLMNYNRTRELTRDDVEKMFDDYYDERGWDIRKGIPTQWKLEGLGLRDLADDLEKGGFL